MRQLFLSVDGRQRDTWCTAFPNLVTGNLENIPTDLGLVWMLLPGRAIETSVNDVRKQLAGRSLIVLADEPSENDAMVSLAAGASGYCNGHAAPTVLRQVAMAVENGGIWVGQGLMQRLLMATARILPAPAADNSAWRQTLTAREQETAVLLATGRSNKEIARQLDITERTVKSHVGAMLEKLGVRDRLQLSLIINGIEEPR